MRALRPRYVSLSAWCGRRDSNPHDFRHGNLNPARLPVPPRPLRAIAAGLNAPMAAKASCLMSPEFGIKTPIDRRQSLGKVLGDEAGSEFARRLAMQPNGCAGRLEGRHALGQKATNN